jgi:SAM-dependent methyltransferase
LQADTTPVGATAPSLYDFAELYDAIVPPGPCEGFYLAEARRARGPVLELACGTGRLTLPLARDGHDVTGLDASPRMLAAAAAKAQAAGLSPRLTLGDMRGFDLRRRFGLVVIACNSLAHLTETEEALACLRAARRHLLPGGTLAFDVVMPGPALLAAEGGWRRLDHGPNPASAIEAEEKASYDPVTQLRTARWRIRPPGQGPVEAAFALRLFFPRELPALLRLAGFEPVALHGDFARQALSPWSLSQVCLARPRRGRHAA